MMKTNLYFPYLLVLLLWIPFSLSAGDSDPKELLEKLESVQGQDKVDVLNKLSSLRLAERDATEAKEYAREAVELAKRLGYQQGEAKGLDNLGNVFLSRNDDENAMEAYYEAYEIKKNLNDEKGIAVSNLNIGKVSLLKKDADAALGKFREAEKIFESKNDKENLAILYEKMGRAYLAKTTPEYGPAISNYEKAFDIKVELEDYFDAAVIAQSMADHQIKLRSYEQASVSLRSAMGIFQSIGDERKIGETFHSMAQVKRLQNYPEDAVDLYEQALAVRRNIPDSLGIAETLTGIGMNYYSLGNNSKAVEAFSGAGELLEKLPTTSIVPDLYGAISDGYEKLGNNPLALQFHKKYSATKDELFNIRRAKATADTRIRYESMFEATDLKNQNEKQQLELENGKRRRNFLMGLVLLGLALAGVLYFSYRRKKKDNLLLEAKNTEIKNKNEEISEKNNALDNLNRKLVDEMAERESIEQSSFAREKFLATMSNEMRTPLNIIGGLTHMLIEQDPRKDQLEHLRTLQFSINNLVVFINDVLDFSKIEAGKIAFETVDFAPRQTLNEIEDRFKLPVRDKGLSLNVNFGEGVPEKLNGDPVRLNQVLTNLIHTSLKYTDQGSIDVNVEVHELVNKTMTLLLTVKDTGKGLDKAQIDKMFRKFSRSSEDIYDKEGSSGFGLAISKRLVDLQNGKIEANSVEGEGTTFTVLLPYKLIGEKKKATENGSKSYAHLVGSKILLVEDNKINQLVVQKMLTKLGMQVTTADNGQEALDRLGEDYFDLALMDIQMPIMDGYRTTAEIRKSQDERIKELPIIALTASAYLTEKEKAKLFGMNDHVGKPFGPEDLLEKINHQLKVKV